MHTDPPYPAPRTHRPWAAPNPAGGQDPVPGGTGRRGRGGVRGGASRPARPCSAWGADLAASWLGSREARAPPSGRGASTPPLSQPRSAALRPRSCRAFG